MLSVIFGIIIPIFVMIFIHGARGAISGTTATATLFVFSVSYRKENAQPHNYRYYGYEYIIKRFHTNKLPV